jgi:hypothetical protein
MNPANYNEPRKKSALKFFYRRSGFCDGLESYNRALFILLISSYGGGLSLPNGDLQVMTNQPGNKKQVNLVLIFLIGVYLQLQLHW